MLKLVQIYSLESLPLFLHLYYIDYIDKKNKPMYVALL